MSLKSLPPLTRTVLLLVILGGMLLPLNVSGQTAPGPRPDERPYFHDAAGLFNDEQLTTLRRDAQLLQSSNIPILVYVRATTEADATTESSQEFADELRQSWGIESAAGADDGLVLLFTWVPENMAASTAVFSHGASTFEGSGLTPASIQETIDTSVRSLIEQQKPFEAVIYLMRETRYDGIYAPLPPPPIEGAAETVHTVLRWLGPALTVTTAFALSWLTARFWRATPSHREIGRTIAVVIAEAVILWTLSVYAQSRAGVASSLLILAALAIATLTWSRAGFISHGSPFVRHLSVPSTNRLMRKRHQARAMLARTEGGER